MVCSCRSPIAATARHFDDRRVRQELAAYRTAGPRATTQGLLRELLAVGPPPATLLDIGSGIGALSFGLLRAGVQSAVCVDISQSALNASLEEARHQGVADRVELHAGDFVELAPTLRSAELVTLDRVVCCYPAYGPLLAEAASHSRRLLALSYPRDRWWVRVALWLENAWRRVRGDSFQAFVHSPAAMVALLERHGFTRRRAAGTWTWQIEIYARNVT
jgi:magnesium-protoporphyrin O-methyltransferase